VTPAAQIIALIASMWPKNSFHVEPGKVDTVLNVNAVSQPIA
jgi:hypothetical protein